MSSSSAGLPTKFDRFRAVWHVDFEYRLDAYSLPVPVAMFAQEHRTGATIAMRRDQLLTCDRAPFDAGADSLVTGYSIIAELSCFKALRWPAPRRMLCTFFETVAQVNGLDLAGLGGKRPSLIEACELFGVPHMSAEHKDQMRDLIINTVGGYSEEEWRAIEDYNSEDVRASIPLLEALAPAIELDAALFRGKFAAAVTDIEARSLPVDGRYLATLQEHWQALRLHYIRRDDSFGLYDGDGSFCEDRFAALVETRGWNWPRTATGKPELKGLTLAKQCRRRPELRPLQRLRDAISEMRLGAFINTVGPDDVSRIPLRPFHTVTGRNLPSGRGKAFLLALPSWTHGLIKPREGYGLVLLDYVGQEIAIGAALSGDQAMIVDFRSGDPHMAFAIRSNLAPEWATKASHGELRDKIKPVSLGISYGMTKHGAAAQTGKSLIWAHEAIARHRHAYPVFARWQNDTITRAMFASKICSPLGWPMHVHAATRTRTLANYMQQSTGADCLRLATIAGHEAGIAIVALNHDALWIEAPLAEIGDDAATMAGLMVRAAEAVTGISIPVEVSAEVRWPMSLGDVRGPTAKGASMWGEVKGLVNGGLQQARARA